MLTRGPQQQDSKSTIRLKPSTLNPSKTTTALEKDHPLTIKTVPITWDPEATSTTLTSMVGQLRYSILNYICNSTKRKFMKLRNSIFSMAAEVGRTLSDLSRRMKWMLVGLLVVENVLVVCLAWMWFSGNNNTTTAGSGLVTQVALENGRNDGVKVVNQSLGVQDDRESLRQPGFKWTEAFQVFGLSDDRQPPWLQTQWLQVPKGLNLLPPKTQKSLLESFKNEVAPMHAEKFLYLEDHAKLVDTVTDEDLDADVQDSVTIIFNVFKGPPKNLEAQLKVAANQQDAYVKEIWVMCFGSPWSEKYAAAVENVKLELKQGNYTYPNTLNKTSIAKYSHHPDPEIHLISSTKDFKFHGRFALALLARTRFLLIVDDDKYLEHRQSHDFIQEHKKRPGILGNVGHMRAERGQTPGPWYVEGPNQKPGDKLRGIAVDYLCGTWFMETKVITHAFWREMPPSLWTGEDIYLSYVAKKYLGLGTFVFPFGTQNKDGMKLDGKEYAATWGQGPHEIRHEIFRVLQGRGMNMYWGRGNITTLVYADTVGSAAAFLAKARECVHLVAVDDEEQARLKSTKNKKQQQQKKKDDNKMKAIKECRDWLNSIGTVALVHRGREDMMPLPESEHYNHHHHRKETPTSETSLKTNNKNKNTTNHQAPQRQRILISPATTETKPSHLIDAIGHQICALFKCSYALEEEWADVRFPRNVSVFNMRLGLGLEDDRFYPWHVQEGDLVTSLAGVIANVRPMNIVLAVEPLEDVEGDDIDDEEEEEKEQGEGEQEERQRRRSEEKWWREKVFSRNFKREEKWWREKVFSRNFKRLAERGAVLRSVELATAAMAGSGGQAVMKRPKMSILEASLGPSQHGIHGVKRSSLSWSWRWGRRLVLMLFAAGLGVLLFKVYPLFVKAWRAMRGYSLNVYEETVMTQNAIKV